MLIFLINYGIIIIENEIGGIMMKLIIEVNIDTEHIEIYGNVCSGYGITFENIFFINYLKYSIPDSNSFWSLFPGTFIIFPL